MTQNISNFLSICLLTLVSGLLFSGTLAGEITGTVTTGVSTGTSGTVIAPPVLTVAGGNYSAAQTVSFDIQGAVYSCFTTDDSVPSCDWDTLGCATGTKYSASFSVSSTQTIQSLSCYAGGNTSSVGTDIYTITYPSSSGGWGGGSSSSYIYVPPVSTPAPENSSETVSGSGIDACTEYFSDTNVHWAKNYICYLKSLGIVNGKNNEENLENSLPENIKFSPEDLITRAEVVKIAVLGFKIPENTEFIKNFPDVSDEDWFSEYVLRAKNSEIINGRKDGTFDPNSSITRAEAVKILLLSHNLSENISEAEDFSGEIFSDVPEYAWYFDIVRTAQELEIISGKSDGKFHPEDNITRAEFSKIAALLLEK